MPQKHLDSSLNTVKQKDYDTPSLSPVLNQLYSIVEDYFVKNPNISLNGLSKKCSVSEPTLRRIKTKQIKTIPTLTTLISLLKYIFKENDLKELTQNFSGPLSDYLKFKVPQIEIVHELQLSEELSNALKEPVKYLIFKLSANSNGVTLEKINELFGEYGEKQLTSLQKEKLVTLKGDRFISTVKNFSLSHDLFVDHFKATADFIKPLKHASSKKNYSPIFNNMSSSINEKSYSKILKVQRAANKKIAEILFDDNNSGDIPTFFLSAVDTLDKKCADELVDEKNQQQTHH